MKMIVGLGNVGKEYDGTRHNVGFMVLDSFSLNFTLEKKFQAYVASSILGDEKCLFVKPTTYMNLSGQAVRLVADYYDILPKDILVIHDDMDLPFGKIKIKSKGSSGGHNGIKSIISSLNTQEFAHLKIGIGHDMNHDSISYVLGHFSKSEFTFLSNNFSYYQKIVTSFVRDGIEKTMSLYNTKE